MNNVFNIKRFGRYLGYDLNNVKNNYGISLLILGLMPIILYVCQKAIRLMFGGGLGEAGSITGYTALGIAVITLACSFPYKVYGFITDKKKGTPWIMLPASTTEKFVSMALVSCVIVPLVFFAIFFASDFLMSLVFRNTYGKAIEFGILPGTNLPDELDFLNLEVCMGCNWVENILALLLGAVCFKKGKFPKTILCYIAFIIICLIVAFSIFGKASITSEELRYMLEDATPEGVARVIRTIVWVAYTVTIGGLGTALFLRLKTIKL